MQNISNNKPAFYIDSRTIEFTYGIDDWHLLKFQDFLKIHRRKVKGPNGKPLSTRELSKMIGIDYEQFRKIINKTKLTKNRDCIIAICALLHIDSIETDKALYLYKRMSKLNNDDDRDAYLIEILDCQKKNNWDIKTINYNLSIAGYDPLDIINHRNKNKDENPVSPYEKILQRVEGAAESLIYRYGTQFHSLATEYLPNIYSITAEMVLYDRQSSRLLYLQAFGDSGFSLYVRYVTEKKDNDGRPIFEDRPLSSGEEEFSTYKVYKNLDAIPDLKPYTIELQKMIKDENEKLLGNLNDTRNFYERISAKVINGSLCVFFEKYNYTLPELNEYYMFIYYRGKYQLLVSKKSRFMRYYLAEDYEKYYSEEPGPILEFYSSVDEIEARINADNKHKDLYKHRLFVYKDMRKRVEELHEKLKSKNVYIKNAREIYDIETEVLHYYGCTKEFQCKYDSEYGDIITEIGVDHIPVISSEKKLVDLYFEDILQGFELGLDSLEEIADAKDKYGEVEQLLFS